MMPLCRPEAKLDNGDSWARARDVAEVGSWLRRMGLVECSGIWEAGRKYVV